MKNLKILSVVLAALPFSANADIIPIFNQAADISQFSVTLGGTDPRGVEASGDLLRVYDLGPGSIAASRDLPASITSGLRLSFTVSNVSDGTGTNGVFVRLLNTGAAANAAANGAMQLTFHSDNTLNVTSSNAAWSGSGTVNNIGGLQFGTTYAINVVVNAAAPGGDNLVYSYLGESRELVPGGLDLYIDDVFIELTRPFLIDNTGYDTALGVGRIGFNTNSANSIGADAYFGLMNIYTGSDITVVPEPATVSLILGALSLAFLLRRRMQISRK